MVRCSSSAMYASRPYRTALSMPSALCVASCAATFFIAFTDWDSYSTPELVGLDNFVWMFTQPEALVTLGNTVVWVILVPLLSTAIVLAYAVFIVKNGGTLKNAIIGKGEP